MQYRVKNGTIPMLNELAQLSFNLIYWSERFRSGYGSDNRENMKQAEKALKDFLKKNIEPIPGTETNKEA